MRIRKCFLYTVSFTEKALVAKNISPKLNKMLKSIIKCINAIKSNAKSERTPFQAIL